MWLKLANAVFTNNLGTLSSLTNSYSITYNLTGGISKTTGATSIPKASGQNYVNLAENFVATFTLGTGAEYTSTSITVGGNALNSSYYSASESSGTVTITIPTTSAQQITGNVIISVIATAGSSGGGSTPIVTNYTFTINPTPSDATITLTASGYAQNGNSITVANGTTVSWSVSASGYTTRTGNWTISGSNKTENVVLVASGGGGSGANPLITWTINGVNIDNGGLNSNTNRLASNIFSPADVQTIVANRDFEFLLYAYSTSTPSSIIGRLNTEGNFTGSSVGTGQWLSTIDMSDYSSSQYYRLVCRYKSNVNQTFTSVISDCAFINGSLPTSEPDSYTPNWIMGKGIDMASTGSITVPNASRQTTQNMFTQGQVSTITANGDFEFLLYAYSTSNESSIIGRLDTEGNFTNTSAGKTGQWLTSFTMSNYPNYHYRLVCRYKSDTQKEFTSVVSDCAIFA